MNAVITEKEVRLSPIKVFRGDDRSDVISFECSRRYGERDLGETSVYMKFLRSDWFADKVLLEKNVDETTVRFDWTVDAKQTAIAGPLRMQIVFEGTDFVFQTEVFTLEVLPSVTGEELYEQEDIMAYIEEKTAEFIKRAEMEAYVEERLATVGVPDLSEYVKETQLADYAEKSALSTLATKAELANYAQSEQLAHYATNDQLANYATTEAMNAALANVDTGMTVVEFSTAKMNLDVEPNKIYVYKQAQTKQNQIYVTMDEEVWKAGDRATLIFSKSEVATSTPSVKGMFGLPVVMRGQDCNEEGQLMGANGMRYTVEFFFDGVNVQGTVFGWADPNLA